MQGLHLRGSASLNGARAGVRWGRYGGIGTLQHFSLHQELLDIYKPCAQLYLNDHYETYLKSTSGCSQAYRDL